MIAIPLLLLVLASGIYLLIQVESKGLGGVYKLLSWLVIVLSLLFILGGVARGVIRHRHMAKFRSEHQQFFKEHGRGFGDHHGWTGHRPGGWKDGGSAPVDSIAKNPQ